MSSKSPNIIVSDGKEPTIMSYFTKKKRVKNYPNNVPGKSLNHKKQQQEDEPIYEDPEYFTTSPGRFYISLLDLSNTQDDFLRPHHPQQKVLFNETHVYEPIMNKPLHTWTQSVQNKQCKSVSSNQHFIQKRPHSFHESHLQTKNRSSKSYPPQKNDEKSIKNSNIINHYTPLIHTNNILTNSNGRMSNNFASLTHPTSRSDSTPPHTEKRKKDFTPSASPVVSSKRKKNFSMSPSTPRKISFTVDETDDGFGCESHNQQQYPNKSQVKSRTVDLVQKGQKAAKIEKICGILHFVSLVAAMMTTIPLARVTSNWEHYRRRCPLYVKTVPQNNVYWGNELMAPCYYGAYMPVFLMVLSLSMVLFHGGLLHSWRTSGISTQLLYSTTYPKVLAVVNSIAFIFAFSVAYVITDGFRQTCLSFKLNPYPEERFYECKDGFDDRDDAYGFVNTYAKLISSIVGSWILMSCILTICILLFTRSVRCKCRI